MRANCILARPKPRMVCPDGKDVEGDNVFRVA